MPRPRAWGDTLFNQPVVEGAATINSDLLVDLSPADTITAARLVGHLYVTTDNALGVVDGAIMVDFGIQVVSAEAFAAGVTPDPNVSSEGPARGWLWRDRCLVINAVGAGPIDWHYVSELKFDIRTMRRVDRGKLILSTTARLAHGTAYNTKFVGIVRALCLT